MIVDPVALPIPRAGRYEFCCGGELEREAVSVAAFLRAFSLDMPIELILHPQASGEIPWIGDWRDTEPDEAGNGSVLTLFSSGTTGRPKPITKRNFVETFWRKRGTGGPDDVWLLTYQPFRWAGITLLSHCIRNACRVAIPKSNQLADIVESAREATHISLTPTLFRKMLVEVPRSRFSEFQIRQVTFGGEPATQKVLDSAREIFPEARITHTYASTEIGDICSASDGRAGFPEDKFRDFLLNDDGELVIGGVPTGDCWRFENGRYHFDGRKEDVVNVGGNKISLNMVEQAATVLPGIHHATARAIPNALMGSVIALDYVGMLEPREVMRSLRAVLPKYACPVTVTQCPEIATAQTGKARR
jgi:acyl-CoA synthetase (AMP-forming)/AMP-acid ligase II